MITFVLYKSASTQAQDYNIYHAKIIQAEKEIFQKGNIEKGLSIYSIVFQDFDFVFLRDCIIAMQIALYNSNEKLFIEFVAKSSKNGLLIRHLPLLKYIYNHAIYNKNKETVHQYLENNRKYYLQRLDTMTLKKIIRLFSIDQVEKSIIPNETNKQREIRYKPLIRETAGKLIDLIKDKGFLGDMLIGIDQNDIMHELSVGKYDAIDYYNKYKNSPNAYIVPLQFNLEEYLFASTLYFPIVVHFSNFWKDKSNKNRYVLHSDEFFQQQITNGRIHPQDLAYLYDLGLENSITLNDDKTNERYFGIRSVFSTTDHQDSLKDAKMNYFRGLYHITPIQCQRAKINFMRKHGMHYSFGWNGCRS